MAQLMYGHIMVGEVRIAYYRTGGEKPPIILLHGFSDNGLCWNQVPVLFEPEFDLIMPDTRGHGRSGNDASGDKITAQAEDVLELIQQLRLHKPVLWGHSMGAEAAALTAARAPKLIRAVILEDPPWREAAFYQDADFRDRRVAGWQSLMENFRSHSEEELAAQGRLQNPKWDESEFFQWARAKKQLRPDASTWLTGERQFWSEIVRQIDCPGLLLTADQVLGAIVSPATASEIQKLWRKVKVVHVPGAGHNIHREQLAAVVTAVDRFLHDLKKWKPG